MILPQEVTLLFQFIWDFFSDWWWLIAPPVFGFLINDLWLIYKRNEYIFYTMEWTMLEVHLPQLVDRTPQAMEQVFAGLHGIYSGPKWFERYGQGKVSPWVSCEIVSTEGDTHFYIRCLSKHRNIVEANIWAQYPDAEIREVEDYVHSVPRQIPNEEWNSWGAEMRLTRPDPYPIRTYIEFEAPVEEQRLDPLSSMLEIMSSLRPGEHLWFQINAQPVFGGWKDAGMSEIDKILGKKPPPPKGLKDIPIIGELLGFMQDVFIEALGVFSPTGAGESAATKPEKDDDQFTLWRLTPGQQDVVKAIERNVGKLGYRCNIRFQYVARRDVFSKARVSEFFGTMRQFNSESLNSLAPNDATTPDIEFKPFANQRNYRRKRLLDREFRFRLFKKKAFVFNTEELATIFHFPGVQVSKAPSVSRIDAKRGEPPTTLPTT